MLTKDKGATLAALVEATGWLPHTTRAAMTGLRKRGFVERTRHEKLGSLYRIVGDQTAPVGA
jgi:DNA-binding IclR family transcriptional regulator